MLPRFLRNQLALRHCKCLFVSALFVCAVMGFVSLRMQPDSLVKGHQAESSRKALSLHSNHHEKVSSDEMDGKHTKQITHNVEFLPPTESQTESVDTDIINGKKRTSKVPLAKIINNGPIFYHDKVPESSARGDLPVETPGLVRQLPSNIYLAQQDSPSSVILKDLPPPFVPERRLVHFDLKGAPPRIDYLQQLIPIIVQLGGTGILLEYEDMFPYDGVLKSISANNHYTRSEIKSLLDVAKTYKLEVIPLVQTFGHLEYVLKAPQFSYLRENPAVPQALCPSQNESFLLVTTLIDQIMSMHEGVKFLHIGCDEVFHIAECALCQLKAKDDLFLSHVHRVASYVRNKYKVVPIIWDDMLRHMTSAALEESKLGDLVEPMVWVYAEDVYRFAGSYVFDHYSQVFSSFWISSSFKGAFGETLVVPDVSRHLENNLNWLTVGQAESSKFRNGLRGIAITGWQRYDHFSNLCELLPAGIPSLAVTLLTTSRGYYNNSLAPTLYQALSCQKAARYDRVPDLHTTTRSDKFLHDKMAMCFFPGAPFFKHTARFLRLEKEIEDFVITTTKRKGWMTSYSVRHNYSSPARVDELLRDFTYLSGSLNALARHTMDTLKNIYDVNTVSEWMEQKLLPLFEKMDRIRTDASILRSQTNWPIRPLPLFDRWRQYNIHPEDYFNVSTTTTQP